MLNCSLIRWFARCLLEKSSVSYVKPQNNGRMVLSLVLLHQHHYYMSNSGSVHLGQDGNVKAKSRKHKHSASHIEGCVKRRKSLAHSEILFETDPLTNSEEEALDKWKSILSKTKHFYEAVFVLGPMCSGKTRAIRDFRCSNNYKHFAYIDTDEIMKGLEGYDDTSIDLFYPSARKVSIHLTDWLLDERMSFIAEGTCVKYEELKDYMVRLKEKGYHIKVKKIDDVSLDVLLDRGEKRVSRIVSQEVIKDIYINSKIGLNKLWENKDEGLFEEFL